MEYALVKSGAMTAMTLNGIVSDNGQDDLISQAAEAGVHNPVPNAEAE